MSISGSQSGYDIPSGSQPGYDLSSESVATPSTTTTAASKLRTLDLLSGFDTPVGVGGGEPAPSTTKKRSKDLLSGSDAPGWWRKTRSVAIRRPPSTTTTRSKMRALDSGTNLEGVGDNFHLFANHEEEKKEEEESEGENIPLFNFFS